MALDLDGTLLTHENVVHPRTCAAIRAAEAKGVRCVAATGRCLLSAQTVLSQSPASLPAQLRDLKGGLFLTGSHVLHPDTGTELRHARVPKAAVLASLGAAQALEGCTAVSFCGEKVLCAEETAETRWLESQGDPKPEAIGWSALADAADDVTMFVLMPRSPRQVPDMMAALASLNLGDLGATHFHPLPNLIDVVAAAPREDGDGEPGLEGKAAGLHSLCTALGISRDAVLAVGDSGNDLAMLRWAGYSCAMGNGSDAVKEAADTIVASNRDADCPGVAEAIERFVL